MSNVQLYIFKGCVAPIPLIGGIMYWEVGRAQNEIKLYRSMGGRVGKVPPVQAWVIPYLSSSRMAARQLELRRQMLAINVNLINGAVSINTSNNKSQDKSKAVRNKYSK